MSEEVINNKITIESIDPEFICLLNEIKLESVEYIVEFYSTVFDKVLNKLNENLKTEEDKLKFNKIKQKHLDQYKSFVDRTLDQQIEQLFNDSEVVPKLYYLSNNISSHDMIEITRAVHPIKQEFVNQLREFETNVNNNYESKMEENRELDNNSKQAFNNYDECRKTLKKVYKYFAIVFILKRIH